MLSVPHGVKVVRRTGVIAEVFQTVVVGDPVVVAHVHPVRARADKRGHDKTVNRCGLANSVPMQIHISVIGLAELGRLQELARPSLSVSVLTGDNAVDTTNSAVVRDFVDALVADHWSPLFGGVARLHDSPPFADSNWVGQWQVSGRTLPATLTF